MRFYTKEWYSLGMKLGLADMFQPVIDKEYSDEEFEQLYQEARDSYIEEERALYDEPPFSMLDSDDLTDEDVLDPEDFDPDDYLIGDIDEFGEEYNLRHPETYEELLEYEKKTIELAWIDYENREPFDEEETGRDFDEDYEDNLSEPDEDVPAWISESVDPRLLAMWRLPESVYKKLVAEEAELQAKYDEIDEIADVAFVKMYEAVPPEYEDLMDELEERQDDYVTAIREVDGDIEIDLAGWDDEGDSVQYTLCFEDAEVIEDDGIVIEATVDEDGDIESTCDLEYYEVYFGEDCAENRNNVDAKGILTRDKEKDAEERAIEVHLLLDDGEPKYYTLRCSDITIALCRGE